MGGRGSGGGGATKGTALSTEEKQTGVLTYQSEERFNGGPPAFQQINTALRDGKPIPKELQKTDKALQQSMKKSEQTEELHRGLKTDANETMNKIIANGEGAVYKMKEYQSTSRERMVARQFKDYNGYLMSIKVPKGTKTVDVNKSLGNKSQHKGEQEVLLNRGLKMKFTGFDSFSKTLNFEVVP